MSKIFTNVYKFHAPALKLAIKLDGFIPKDQTKWARDFSLDESFLVRLICLKVSKFSLKVPTIKNHRPLLYLAENAKEGKTLLVIYHRKMP